jgi:Zn-dependent membrane protease YugP
MKLRSLLVPVANVGSNLGYILFLAGLIFFQSQLLVNVGILFFSAAVFFTVVTLPVELDASRRALASLSEKGILVSNEIDGARAVLRAAALTYLAAALMAILNLVRMILISRR